MSADRPDASVRSGVLRGGEGFPQDAFERLSDLEEGHFWFRSRNRLILWALGRYFPHAERLLEIGCGTGFVLTEIRNTFPSMRLVGTDVHADALRIARKRVAADLVQLDAQEIDFRDEFDVVCAFDVLEHLDDDSEALRRLAEATRPGGGLLVTVPQYEWLWSPADDYGRHRRRYTKRAIDGKIESAGFTVLRSSAWVATLLPLVALSRLRDRRSRHRYDPGREFRLPAALNRTLELALDTEAAAIRLGVTLPFGTSRLVVGAKS